MDFSNPKKIKILEAAARVIEKHGIRGANARKIADEAKMSPTNIYHHFGSEASILTSLFHYIVVKNRTELEKQLEKKRAKTYAEKLSTYLEVNLQWGYDHPPYIVVLFHAMAQATHDREVFGDVVRMFDHGEETVFSYLAGGLAEKEWTITGSARELARVIHKALKGLVLELAYRKRYGKESVNETIKMLNRHVFLLIEASGN